MKDIRIINGKFIRPDFEETLRALGMRRGSRAVDREKIRETYDRLLPEIKRLIVPRAACSVRDTPDGRVFVLLLTLGGAVSDYQNRLIREGSQYDALIADAMATSAVFRFKGYLRNFVISICHEMKIGLCGSVSPENDLYPAFVRFSCQSVDSERTLGVRVTKEGAMLPQKSMCEVYRVSENPQEMHFGEDCSTCGNTGCAMRNAEYGGDRGAENNAEDSSRHPETGKDADFRETVSCPPGVNVLEFLQRRGISIAAPCGGQGLCGRCRVRVTGGEAPFTPEDVRFFTPEEIADGVRLACRLVPEREIAVAVLPGGSGENIKALTMETARPSLDAEKHFHGEKSAFGVCETGGIHVEKSPEKSKSVRDVTSGIAIDIGTTTLAGALVDTGSGAILKAASGTNHQNRFGSDVIARTRAAVLGHAAEMQSVIRADLIRLIEELCRGREPAGGLRKIVIAANTTMQHLLMGWDMHGLLAYPFRPTALGGTYTGREVFGGGFAYADCPVALISGISTYVGGDITAGIFASDIDRADDNIFLVDLGTNGELACGSAGGITVGSAAAGPALEGGNISCGVSSIPGAVCSVRPESGASLFAINTIGNRPPVGLCGTGVIELCAALLESGLIDKTGKLRDPYFHEGVPVARKESGEWIRFTQQDVREVQLAKGAIRAGIESLRRGKTVKKLVLAGGFGYYLNPKYAAEIGLIPPDLADRAEAAGNTALRGAVRCLTDQEGAERIKRIREISKEDILGNDPHFQEMFVRYMNFEV